MVALIVLIIAVPAVWSFLTWLLMLFLGNVGLDLSFWGALPGAILLSTIGGSGAARSQKS